MPLLNIAERLHLGSPPEQQETLQVIVYTEAGRSVGLIVDQIVDIVEQAVVVEHRESAGLLGGSAVIQEKVTDLLNVGGLMKHASVTEANV